MVPTCDSYGRKAMLISFRVFTSKKQIIWKSLKLNCLNEPFTSQKGSAIICNNTGVTKHSHLEILESSLINECEQPEITKQNSVLKIALTLSVQKFEIVNNEKNTFLRIRIGRKMGGLLFQKCSGGIKLRIIHNTTSC